MSKNNKIILIIDDNQGILKPLSILLSRFGYLVRTAQKGTSSAIMQKPFANLILLDMRLQDVKGEDGPDVCVRIKNSKEVSHIPVVMFSADSGGKFIAEKVGADDFIEKPFNMVSLVKKIKEYI